MLINVNNLTKSFKLFKRKAGLKGAIKSFFNREYEIFTALENINLNITEGEIIGILGENGAGKTTLIKLMVGLLYPNNGSINIDGYDPWKRNHTFLSNISVVMGQKNQLWWDIPASESFLLNKHIYNLDDSNYNKTLDELVEYLNVGDKINVQVRRLSLGERMKMEIIVALLHRPKIILLDEPTLGLDVISQAKIREFVKYYNKEHKTTFVITSHYTKDIQEMCKRVFVLHKGRSVYDGDFKTLIKNVNPRRRLVFEFKNNPENNFINLLHEKFTFQINDKILTAILPELMLQELLSILLKNHAANNISFEDLPVDDTMRSFFQNPNKYIQ
jgi:ABC-2 type transport system ATP-binding protein